MVTYYFNLLECLKLQVSLHFAPHQMKILQFDLFKILKQQAYTEIKLYFDLFKIL